MNDPMFRALFETTLDGILVANDEGRYIDANPAACALLGMKRENIIGRMVVDFADPQRKEDVRRTWHRFLEHGFQRGLFRIFRPDGTTRHVDYIAKARVKPGVHLTILRDITERNQAERSLRESEDRLRMTVDELRAAKETAEAATRTKSQFIANISHEIRTPINGMLGTVELLRQTSLTPEQKEYADIMQDSGETLMALVGELLDFSRIEAGKLKLEIRNFDLSTTVNAVMALFAQRVQFKRLELISQIQKGIPSRLRGDPVRLRQVLMNLIGNAIKFTDHGKVTVNVTKVKEEASRVILRFSIRDTGPGISRSQQELLFLPFSQADTSAMRRHGGTGLGLAISKQLVELMAGTIGLDSSPGHGSTFWFSLPFQKQRALARTDSRSTVRERLGLKRPPLFPVPLVSSSPDGPDKPRILLAEDNRINRIVAVRQLEKLGHKIDTVSNGREALKGIKRKGYDLILMDCQMPKMDGYRATIAIRRLEKKTRTHTPIIAMTAHAMEEDRKKCLAAGMDDYISKPVQLAQLRSLLSKWLKSAGSGVVKEDGDLKRLYFEDTSTQLKQLEQAIQSRSAHQVKEIAHSALGASATMGMTSIAEPLRDLESMAARNDLKMARTALQKAKTELELTHAKSSSR